MGTAPPDIDFQYGIGNPANPLTTLYGMDAVKQVDAWYNYGTMETSASVLAKTTITTTNISANLARKVFVLLGCTSALGPARPLLRIPGVRVLGVSRGGKKLDSLIDFVRDQCPDDTSFTYPKTTEENKDDALYPNGGACILADGPRIVQWILDQTDSKKDELVIVPLATSQDGEKHVRLAASMDLIVQRVLRSRPNTTLWTYQSPTLPLIVPPMAATNAEARLQERPTWESWAHSLTRGSWLEPSVDNTPEGSSEGNNGTEGKIKRQRPDSYVNNNDYVLVNGIVTAQGPCYVLAKTLQQWRCMVAYYRDAHIVSAPYAPLTRTPTAMASDVMTNMMTGMHHFEPMLAFDVRSASTLICSILIAQLQLMNRPLPDMDESPYTLFWEGAAHGGVWSCPYTLESISALNYAMGKSTYYPFGYIPPMALADLSEEATERTMKKFNPDILLTLTDVEDGEPMPDIVKERLDFM